MMPYVSGQIKFEDGDLGYKVKVTVTKKLKNTKKIGQKFKYLYFWISFMLSDSVCYYRHFDAKYGHIIQDTSPKLNYEIWKKTIYEKK